MAYVVALRDIDENDIEIADDPDDLLPRMLAACPEEEFPYLHYVDPYDTTSFNSFQMKPFLREWSRLYEHANERETKVLRQVDREALLEIGFLPKDNPDARFVEWRDLFGRAGLTSRETRVLLALARRVQNVGRIARSVRPRGASPEREESD